MRSLRPAVAAVALASLVLAGCGSDDSGSDDKTDTAGAPTASAEPDTWPLTGLELSGDKSAARNHPVLVAKIDNTPASSPQVGLGSADLVVEELVEGGLTRLAAFFYSKLPTEVGPIRSMRASDIGIVAPVDGQMVTSGAAPQTIARLKQAGVAFHQEGQSTGFRRDSGRSSTYSVMADLAAIAKAAKVEAARPEDYLPWGDAADLPKGQKATSFTASFGGKSTAWTFEGGKYHNQSTFAADGDEFLADSVLVLSVQVGDAGYRDPAGNPVPESKVEGSGPAVLFHQGRMIRGTFTKDGVDGSIELQTKAGDLIVPAGKVWIELVPASNGGVTVG